MASLSITDKARVRHALAYLGVTPAASIQLGFPRASQAMFLVESAMDKLLPETIPYILRSLDVLDGIECQLIEAMRRMKAERLGEITLRKDETDALEGEYRRWAQRLADDLGVPLNAYSERFRNGSGTRPLNISVQS